MFTWICPKCGSGVDVAEDTCPHCADQGIAIHADEPWQPTQEIAPTPGESTSSDTSEASPRLSPRERLGAAPDEGPDKDGVAKSAGTFNLQTRHYLIFAGGLAVAILGAIWLSGNFSGLRLEEPVEMAESPVETFAIGVQGPIEVSGIRPYYDTEFQAHVRAFVANHSKQEQSVAFRVHLRVREASQQAPPLATFDVVISPPLAPNGGQEVDVQLRAMGSLQSLPRWNEMRVDLEVLGGSGG